MRIPLQSATRKFLLLGFAVFVVLIYLSSAGTEYLAAYFSARPDLKSLQRASRLAPGNAEYEHRIGRYFSLVAMSPSEALPHYQSAVTLGRYKARYWFSLAVTYQILGATAKQMDALERAIQSDPKTPDVAWQAANLYLVQGETAKAMHEFRIVLENDPSLTTPALQLCWRANPDIDSVLRDVAPPLAGVYAKLLDFMISRKQPAAAAKVWTKMVELHQTIETQSIFAYVRYLVEQREVTQAAGVWRQSASISELANYQPAPANLVVNGDFSLPVLNGGFDWQYDKMAGVSFVLDPTEGHLGVHSLLISFAGQPLDDVGLRQIVPVEPATRYDFSACFKAPHMDGAGGARITVQDFYSGDTLYLSDDLKNAEVWKQVNGTFTSKPDARLLVIRVRRIPAGSPIRGTLWIDGIRLAATQSESRP